LQWIPVYNRYFFFEVITMETKCIMEEFIMKRYKVGVLGATGMVGQRFISLLNNPLGFETAVLAASGKICRKNL
jgi:hypothetical protein